MILFLIGFDILWKFVSKFFFGGGGGGGGGGSGERQRTLVMKECLVIILG